MKYLLNGPAGRRVIASRYIADFWIFRDDICDATGKIFHMQDLLSLAATLIQRTNSPFCLSWKAGHWDEGSGLTPGAESHVRC